MRFKLDTEAAGWFRREVLRRATLVVRDADFHVKLRAAWHDREDTLDLTTFLDDRSFLSDLAKLLTVVPYDHIHAETFCALAKRVLAARGISVIDRLAAVVEPPKAVPINCQRDTTRDVVAQRIADRRRRPRQDRQQ